MIPHTVTPEIAREWGIVVCKKGLPVDLLSIDSVTHLVKHLEETEVTDSDGVSITEIIEVEDHVSTLTVSGYDRYLMIIGF